MLGSDDNVLRNNSDKLSTNEFEALDGRSQTATLLPRTRDVSVSQPKYIKQILKTFRMVECKV